MKIKKALAILALAILGAGMYFSATNAFGTENNGVWIYAGSQSTTPIGCGGSGTECYYKLAAY